MLKKIKTILTSFAVLSAMLVPALVPLSVSAQAEIQGSLCQGAELETSTTAPSDTTCAATTADAGTNVNGLIADVINIFSLIVGVVAVIMIIVGGFRYITSGGNDTNVGAAKNTILYAIIGLVIVALAQFIVRFVLQKVTT